jgi:hypothetical protein
VRAELVGRSLIVAASRRSSAGSRPSLRRGAPDVGARRERVVYGKASSQTLLRRDTV